MCLYLGITSQIVINVTVKRRHGEKSFKKPKAFFPIQYFLRHPDSN